ncbi:MAG: hypothetical protein ACRCZL_02240 [Cetobacterium sp.]
MKYYSEEQVNKFLGINTVKKNKKIIKELISDDFIEEDKVKTR